MSVTATAGIIYYGTSTTYSTVGGSYTAKTNGLFFPFLGGAKYYYPGPVFRGLYGSFEAGFGLGSASYSYTGTTTTYARPDAARGVIVCPGVGFHNGQFDFSLRYYSAGMVGLRAAYVFKAR